MEFKPIIWHEGASYYQEVKPALALQSYIDCYWLSLPQTDQVQSRVIPDLCADFIMTFSVDMRLKNVAYSGPNTRYFMSVCQSAELIIGIRCHLCALRNWLPIDLSQTKDQLLVEWDGFVHFSKYLMTVMELNPTIEKLISSFNEFFLMELSVAKTGRSSDLIKNIIHNSMELTDYRDVIRREVFSERTIQRVFREETGLSPYEVHDILRFQKSLKSLLVKPPETSLSEIALSHGYYDQAHFTRRFKIISGLTPKGIR